MLSRFIRLFGQRVTLSDLLALGAFAVGTLVTILDLTGLWDRLGLKPVEVVILLLLTILILYSIQEKWEIARRNEELQHVVQSYGTVALAKGEDEVFSSAARQVQTHKFDVVRIYAPVGVWRVSEQKKQWFKTLSEALDQGTQTVTEIRAVFGLPPTKDAFESVTIPELTLFKGKDAARLRFLLPLSDVFKDLPGTGLVILGDDAVRLGFAVHGHHAVVDSTIFIQNKDIVDEVSLWFDEVWETVKDFLLQEARRGISLDQGFEAARASYQQGTA